MIAESEIRGIEKLTREDRLRIFEILVKRFGDRADSLMLKIIDIIKRAC